MIFSWCKSDIPKICFRTNIKYINRALDKLEKEEVDTENEIKSVLQQLLKKDRKVAISMAISMMVAGIDTVRYS